MTTQIERFVFQSLGGSSDAFTPLASSEMNIIQEISLTEQQSHPPEPMLSLIEVEQVRKEAYASGFKDAQKEAESKAQSELSIQNQAIANAESTISLQLQEIFKAQATLFESKQKELSGIALAIAKKVSGNALKRDPLTGIEELVAQCLKSLVGESKISITVHPSLHLLLQKRLQPLMDASGFEGETSILSDDSLAKEDCKVEWKNGSAVRDSAKIWSEIEALISSMKLTAPSKNETNKDEDNTIYLANR